MQSQLVCSGCRTVLLYPRGASNVRCTLCSTVTAVPPPGMDMAQLICGGCRTLLMHARGATSVRCSCCHTVNLVPGAAAPPPPLPPNNFAPQPPNNFAPQTPNNFAPQPPNNFAHVNCGNCHTTLMYPAGAPSVKCALCHYITNVNMGDSRIPVPVQRPPAVNSTSSTPTNNSQNQTVVVQNPMTVDESGKLVSNVVVGVTT